MIRFVRGDWLAQVFTFRGTVLELLWWPTLLYFIYCLVAYAVAFIVELPNNPASLHFLGGCVSFLVIFQLNQSYDRFRQGIRLSADFFSHLGSVVSVMCSYMRRGDERMGERGCEHTGEEDRLSASSVDWDEKELHALLAIAAEVHTARLTLAIGVALKFHFRIAEQVLLGGTLNAEQVQMVLFDLHRIRGLLLPNEQTIVDMASGLAFQQHAEFHVCLKYLGCNEKHPGDSSNMPTKEDQVGVALPLLLLDLLRGHVSKAVSTHWGCPERVMSILEVHFTEISRNFELMDRLITMPLPLAYLQHSKVIVLLFSLVYPLCIRLEMGFWAKVISPCIIFFALLGFELLADELENPVGQGCTDISTLELIHGLEARICKTFTTIESHHDALFKDGLHILETMGVHGSVPQPPFEAMRARFKAHRSFRFYFSWLELPRHVVAEMVRQDKGYLESDPLRSAHLQAIRQALWAVWFAVRTAWQRHWPLRCLDRFGPFYGRLCTGEQPESAGPGTPETTSGSPEPRHGVGISHFLCLRENKAALESLCEETEEEALAAIFAHNLTVPGAFRRGHTGSTSSMHSSFRLLSAEDVRAGSLGHAVSRRYTKKSSQLANFALRFAPISAVASAVVTPLNESFDSESA